MAFVGQTRSRKLMAELDGYGIGEMTQRGQSPRRGPFALDNLAFADFKAGRPFDALEFWRTCMRLHATGARPVFVVVPDIVGGGLRSLETSIGWLPLLERLGWPMYLAVQEGMTQADVEPHLSRVAGIFVGGASHEWKEATSPSWLALAHRHGLRCHIGRVGTARKVRWAREIGADSIDSCVPLFAARNMRVFVEALGLAPIQNESVTVTP